MTGNSHIFNNFDTNTSSSRVTIADGSISQVLGSGTVNLSPSISLSLVLSLPKFSFNLLSVSRITSNLQCSVKFYPEYCVFKDLKTKKIIGRGRECDGLYVFETDVSKSLVGLSSSSLFEAHCRLGHPSLQNLKKLCPEYSHLSSLNCDSCEFAKHKRVHLSHLANKRAASLFELVHSDVWGPCPITSKSGFKYFVTFVDDYSRVNWLYLIKNQSEVFTHFHSFVAEIKT
ncbi:retrovirus-related pol polyprotein from transposon TNT 1-94 [Tanacetum coccineum]